MEPDAVFKTLYQMRARSALGSLLDIIDVDPDDALGPVASPEGGFAEAIRQAVAARGGVLEEWEQMAVGSYVAEEAVRGVDLAIAHLSNGLAMLPAGSDLSTCGRDALAELASARKHIDLGAELEPALGPYRCTRFKDFAEAEQAAGRLATAVGRAIEEPAIFEPVAAMCVELWSRLRRNDRGGAAAIIDRLDAALRADGAP